MIYNFSIIIVGDNKERYIIDTINSCLQNNYKNFEVLLVFNKLTNISLIKNKFRKKIRYIKINKKLTNPIHDQMYKIKFATQLSKGENILLCDGDDFFLKNKLTYVLKFLRYKKKILFHDYIKKKEYKKKYISIKKYKNKKFYKILINNWPDKIATSTICLKKSLLKYFFLKNNIFDYKYLAIDARIIIFYLKKIYFLKKILIIKNENLSNLDKNYSNIFSKKFYYRRFEQHSYYAKYISTNLSIEYLILKIFKNLRLIK